MVLVKRVRAPGIPVCFYILLSRGELCVVPPGVFLWVVWLWDGVRVCDQLRCLGHVDWGRGRVPRIPTPDGPSLGSFGPSLYCFALRGFVVVGYGIYC